MLKVWSVCALLVLALATSCTDSGTMEVRMTDATIEGTDVAQVIVNISDVSVHTSASAGATDSGWKSLTLSNNTALDLLSLQNGINQILASVSLPAGQYQQMRITVASAKVVFADSTNADVTIPNGTLKFNLGATIENNKTYGVVLDFDAAASLRLQGGTWRMNPPVITVKQVYLATVGSGGTCTALTDLCVVGTQKCCGTSPTIQCIDIASDENNCGGCGTVCTSGQTCTNGVCATTST